MFTGIIESVGSIRKITTRENYLIFSIEHRFPLRELKIGQSVSCDGACLTLVSFDAKQFTVEVSQETIARTICRNYQKETCVNLERAVRAGDRLDGHFVTGHIDNIGTVSEIEKLGQSLGVTVKYDDDFDSLVVEKGSIALNGVSLTVNQTGNGWCTVNLIPYTIEHTNLKELKVNDGINIEFDLIGKYAVKNSLKQNHNLLTFAKLKESGW